MSVDHKCISTLVLQMSTRVWLEVKPQAGRGWAVRGSLCTEYSHAAVSSMPGPDLDHPGWASFIVQAHAIDDVARGLPTAMRAVF